MMPCSVCSLACCEIMFAAFFVLRKTLYEFSGVCVFAARKFSEIDHSCKYFSGLQITLHRIICCLLFSGICACQSSILVFDIHLAFRMFPTFPTSPLSSLMGHRLSTSPHPLYLLQHLYKLEIYNNSQYKYFDLLMRCGCHKNIDFMFEKSANSQI